MIKVKRKMDIVKHFNNERCQYEVGLILNPPVHTSCEIEKIIKEIDSEGFKKGLKVRVVDFGAGTGRLTIPLLERGFDVLAVDISKKSLLKLKELSNRLGYGVKIAAELAGNNNCSCIVGCDILHHIDLATELPCIYKSLCKGGFVVFSEPNAFNISWYPYFFWKKIWKYEKGIRNLTLFKIKKFFGSAGFSKIEVEGLGLFPRSLMKAKFICKLNDYLGNLPIFKMFAYRFIIKASKSN